MFVRWKNRTLVARNGSGLNDRSHYAVIVKNQRIEGRTRQKVVKYLAHINESELDLPEHREYFWRRVDQGLMDLALTRQERAEIEMKLACMVRRPGEEQDVELLRHVAGHYDLEYDLESLQRMHGEHRTHAPVA